MTANRQSPPMVHASPLCPTEVADSGSSLSPDGKRLVFVRWEHHQYQLLLFDFASQNLRTMASGAVYWQPAWSSDGHNVVFRERIDDERGRSQNLVAMSLENGERKPLVQYGSWS